MLLILMNSKSEIVYANKSAHDKLGYEYGTLVGMRVWEWDPLFPEEAWLGFWEQLKVHKFIQVETQHRSKSGLVIPVEVRSYYYPGDGKGNEELLLGFVQDLTEKKKAEELLRKQANYDSLTGLANRTLLLDRLEQLLLQARREESKFALLFIDLTTLKS